MIDHELLLRWQWVLLLVVGLVCRLILPVFSYLLTLGLLLGGLLPKLFSLFPPHLHYDVASEGLVVALFFVVFEVVVIFVF